MHTTMRKALIIGGVILALALIGCRATEPEAGERVRLDMTAQFEPPAIHIAGSTDLPDGTLIAYEVTHDGFIAQSIDAEPQLFADGYAEVSDGSYAATVDVTGWPPGAVTAWVSFQTILGTSVKQPTGVVARFGEMGEKLVGDDVTHAGGMNRIVIERTVDLP